MATLTKMERPDAAKARDYFHAKNEFTTGPMEVSYRIKAKDEHINVVDLRARDDYEKGHVPGSVNLPQERWESEEGLEKEKTNILLCYSQQCHLASKAGEKFSAKGYPVMEMEGGFKVWKDSGLEIEK